jgi:RimJ/RimL family protein N-acetyltransferase
VTGVRPPALFPRTQGTHVRLRPATPADGPDCYRLIRRLGGRPVPDEERFLAVVNRRFDGFFAVTGKDDDAIVGYTALADSDPALHVRLACWMEPGDARAGCEAASLTISYAFAMRPLLKVYIHVTDGGPDYLAAVPVGVAQLEAALSDYEFFDGEVRELRIFAIYRDDWLRRAGPMAERLV